MKLNLRDLCGKGGEVEGCRPDQKGISGEEGEKGAVRQKNQRHASRSKRSIIPLPENSESYQSSQVDGRGTRYRLWGEAATCV